MHDGDLDQFFSHVIRQSYMTSCVSTWCATGTSQTRWIAVQGQHAEKEYIVMQHQQLWYQGTDRISSSWRKQTWTLRLHFASCSPVHCWSNEAVKSSLTERTSLASQLSWMRKHLPLQSWGSWHSNALACISCCQTCTSQDHDSSLVHWILMLSSWAYLWHWEFTLKMNCGMWIAFGVGKNLQCLAAHQMAAGLGPVKARTLLVNKVTTRSLNVCHLVERQYQHVYRF